MEKLRIVILAAGRSKRMHNEELPKVLIKLHDRPIISYLLEAVQRSKFDKRPVVVVGWQAGLVIQTLGNQNDYIVQNELLGTGHAVLQTKNSLQNKAENIMVLYGDHPYLKPESIKKLAQIHIDQGHTLSLMTLRVSNFKGQYRFFDNFGRIIRGEAGKIKEIVEKNDASPEQLKIKEVNPAYYCFKGEWLWENLEKIKNNNIDGEYYLTDLVKMAIDQGYRIDSIDIDPKEAIGINTPEHLELARKQEIGPDPY